MSVKRIIWLGFFLRFIVAVWNGFFGPSFGADLDADAFHVQAVECAKNFDCDSLRIGWIYSFLLGVVYRLSVSSLFLGSLLSCFAWFGSARLLAAIMRLLAFDRWRATGAMIIFSSLPTSIFFTSVTLREVYQLLFVNLAVYAVFSIYLSRKRWYWLVLLLAGGGMGMLHGGLLAFAFFTIASTFALLALRGRQGVSMVRIALIGPIVVLIAAYGLSVVGDISYSLDNGVGAAIETYQQAGVETVARANYKDDVQIDGIVGLALFLPKSLFQYLFEPLPWHMSGLADVELLIENGIRAWLIWRTLVGLRRAPPSVAKRSVLFIFFAFVVLELIWSLGTVNWGTAARHHVPSIGLLVIGAFAYPKFASKRRGVIGKKVESLI